MNKRLIYAEDAIEEIVKRLGVRDESYLTAQEKSVVQVLKDMPSAQPRWTPVTEALPDEDGVYLVTDHDGEVVRYVFHMNESSREFWNRNVVAWMQQPEPYKREQK